MCQVAPAHGIHVDDLSFAKGQATVFYTWKPAIVLRAPAKDTWILDFDDQTLAAHPELQQINRVALKDEFLRRARARTRTYTSV